ncbi:tripartite tricarboxylate transporter substrate-binding protein [Roseomonas sp. CCTCC AB2023176]|uniref:tripartite tricarboxylate transporter substrate-binding protein n=1 Tax=Roseomonas sp. CCTCC AB2023176 TaxID=3342640 RepID=UPI0035E0076C
MHPIAPTPSPTPTLARRDALALTTALTTAFGAALASAPAQAQAPSGRTTRVLVGFPPGGTSDSVSRLYTERLRATNGGVVENRPGAGGRLALEALKAAVPDGNTMCFTPASMLTIYPHLYTRTLRYDPVADFVAVTPTCVFPFALAVKANHPARTLPDFITWSRAQNGGINWASPVPGSMPHFIGTELARKTGLTMTHVPYRGSAPAVQDLLAGTIPMVLLPLGELTAFHRSGDVRIVGVTSPERMPRLDDVPTFAEAGHADLTHEEWYGAFLPARTPEPVVAQLHAALAAAAASPEVREVLTRIDMAPLTLAPAAFAERMRRELAAWAPIVQASGFRPDD